MIFVKTNNKPYFDIYIELKNRNLNINFKKKVNISPMMK